MPIASGAALAGVRQAAKSSGLARKVFTQGANGVSSAQVVMELNQALKLAGIQLPEGTQLGMDGAQVILAGGAFASDLASGAATLQCVGDIGIGVGGLTAALSTMGLVDPEVSDFVNLGVNFALVIASGGSNVLADIGSVISLIQVCGDIGASLFGSQAAAQAMAKRGLATAIAGYVSPQVASCAKLVQAYSSGALNLFDLIGQIALTDPEQFATLFPGLATFFPSWASVNLTSSYTSSGLFGSSTDTETATFYSLVTTKQQVQDVLVEQYLTIPMTDFESFETVAPVISLQAASILSLILQSGGSGDITMGFGFNVIGAMRGLGITPSILGDDWLFKGLQRNEKDITDWETHLPFPPITLPNARLQSSGVVVNGVPILTASQSAENQEALELVALQKLMQKYDEQGDIEALLAIPEAVAILQRWANFHVNPAFYTQAQYNSDSVSWSNSMTQLTSELTSIQGNANDTLTISQLRKEIASLQARKPVMPVGEITNIKLVGTSITTQDWFSTGMSTDPATQDGIEFWNYVSQNYAIDLSDYWKILNTLSTMQKSALFHDDTSVQDFTGNLNAIEEGFKSAYSFVLAKQLNVKARINVSNYTGIPTDKMGTRLDSKNNLIFYQKKAS